MSLIDNYEERISNLVKTIIKNKKDRLGYPNFKGILLYNCGIPESKDIASKVEKHSGSSLEWIVKRIELQTNLPELIPKLRKKEKRNPYLLIDTFSNENPVPNISNKIIYPIDVGNY